MRSDHFEDDVTLISERNTLVWGAFLIGVASGFVAVYIVVAQPMFNQLKELHHQTLVLQEDVQELVGERNQAFEAATLLGDLRSMKAQLPDARATVREMRNLRADLLEESRHTRAAHAAVREMSRLQETALEQQELTTPAAVALQELTDVQRQVIEAADELPLARSAAGEFCALKDQLVASSPQLDAARTHANRLLALQDALQDEAGQSAVAIDSLDRLLELKDRLIDQTPSVAGAVQNLEILSDFHEEFTAHVDALEKLREGLTQLLLMETTIGRVARALEPLTQIVNIRRLSDDELREAARTILDQRATRLGSRDSHRDPLSQTAERDPFQAWRDGAAYDEAPAHLGANEADDKPLEAMPLPLTEPTATY
ncbi:MAG: hypothetical protein ACT4QC_10065 [Planctomycetaceae bacterium]